MEKIAWERRRRCRAVTRGCLGDKTEPRGVAGPVGLGAGGGKGAGSWQTSAKVERAR